MENEVPCNTTSSAESIPINYLGDDATSADQIALAIVEILGKRVLTTDAESVGRSSQSVADDFVRVINSAARALPEEKARAQNERLATGVLAGEKNIPVVQIDSRLRGIRNALCGLYESLDFDFLLFVPAEPELGRLVQSGNFCHVENGRLIPFHESVLVQSAENPPKTSDLRDFLAARLGVSVEQVVSINESVVSNGSEAIANCIDSIKRQAKTILIPDVTKPEHFESIISATKKLQRARILIAGSRTFLRSFFTSFRMSNAGIPQMEHLSQAIDRQKRGAPLAVVASLEPAMNAQIEYAQRALGPNLVTVSFDSKVVAKDDQSIRQEIDRAQQLVVQSLKAMRPVLLHTFRMQIFNDPALQQKDLDAISQVVADDKIHSCLTSLFISGGQTAETIKKTLRISSVDIQGAFQEGIAWGIPLEGALKNIPFVTKGGGMGKEDVLFDFFEQGHLLPRANVLPVVTPLTSKKEVDEEGIEKLIAHLVRLGATDAFAVGNAGEFRFLTNAQRLQALEIFARKAEGKLRVFAGITGDTADETRKNYEAAGKLGVYATVMMPLYFLKSSEEILPFVESLAPIEPKLPLILYNNPARTEGQHISFEAVEALPFPVMAIKDSSGDKDRFDRYAQFMPVYEGQQRQIFEGYQHGARGSIGIIGHVCSLPNEFFAPATSEARREEITHEINALSKQVKQGGAEVAAYKYVLSLMNVIGDTVASNEPERELTDEQTEKIKANNAELISKLSL